MKYRSFLILFSLVFLTPQVKGQLMPMPRTFGVCVLQLDDATGSMNTLSIGVNDPILQSYMLKFPSYGPVAPLSYMVVDEMGNIDWSSSILLPPLAPGNIWYGNTSSVATQLPPGPFGSLLSINGSSMPEWTNVIPSPTTMSASQLTSGTLQPGVTITVGPSSTITTSGDGVVTGTVAPTEMRGAGPNQWTGEVPIPMSAPNMFIPYSKITPNASVLVSIKDPNASVFMVLATVTTVTAGTGFTVEFSAPYPNPAGRLHYMVVNP